MFAKVAVMGLPFCADKPYDYLVPSGWELCPGMRVLVPFGAGRRKTEGMVLSLSERADYPDCKEIAARLDEEPLLDEALLRLCVWVRERFYCPFYDAVKAALPAGLWLRYEERVKLLPGSSGSDAAETLTGAPEQLYRLLREHKGEAGFAVCKAALGKKTDAALKTLLEKGICEATIEPQRRARGKTDWRVTLAVEPEETDIYLEGKRAPLQREVLRLLCELGSAGAHDIYYYTGASSQTLRALEKGGQITLAEQPVFRRPIPKTVLPPELILNKEQQSAYERVLEAVHSGAPACGLLFGVTGSGKTSVYIALTRQILAEGGSVLLMVPEIALTPQLMSLFSAHFGELVALLHSGLTLSERLEQWKQLRDGKARVALGTRSAVFAPLRALRLIIIDEEQEGSYQSGASPRYHARDVAKFRCVQYGATLLLGSATPSVDSYQAALEGKHFLLRLEERYNRRPLPSTRIVDMRGEQRQNGDSIISAALHGEIHENLSRDEQTILLLNRRGHSRRMICPACGHTPECERCSVSLSFHSANGRLMCHYCGHSEPWSSLCPVCGADMRPLGAGTQKVEKELRELFPDTAVLRMDTDTTGGRNAHEKLLERFRRERIPLLVGTQMVAKGLDFENVTLVGVLDADTALWMEDYRAYERAFCLFAQVIGRAGRGSRPGRALLQTYSPHHPLIEAAAAQDYGRFFAEDIALRRLRSYPPFGRMVRLTLLGQVQEAVIRSALRVRGWLDARAPGGLRVIGPAPDRVARVNELYRYHILLLGDGNAAERRLVQGILVSFPGDKQNRGVKIFAENG